MKTRTLKELVDAGFEKIRDGTLYYKTCGDRTMVFEEVALNCLFKRIYYGKHIYVEKWLEGEARR